MEIRLVQRRTVSWVFDTTQAENLYANVSQGKVQTRRLPSRAHQQDRMHPQRREASYRRSTKDKLWIISRTALLCHDRNHHCSAGIAMGIGSRDYADRVLYTPPTIATPCAGPSEC